MDIVTQITFVQCGMDGNRYRSSLFILAQGIVIPYDIRINKIFPIALGKNEFGNGPVKKGVSATSTRNLLLAALLFTRIAIHDLGLPI